MQCEVIKCRLENKPTKKRIKKYKKNANVYFLQFAVINQITKYPEVATAKK